MGACSYTCKKENCLKPLSKRTGTIYTAEIISRETPPDKYRYLKVLDDLNIVCDFNGNISFSSDQILRVLDNKILAHISQIMPADIFNKHIKYLKELPGNFSSNGIKILNHKNISLKRADNTLIKMESKIIIDFTGNDILIIFEPIKSDSAISDKAIRHICHELRQPLQAISYITDELKNVHQDEERLQLMDDLKTAAILANDISTRTIDFGKIASGEYIPVKSLVSISELVDTIVRTFNRKNVLINIRVITRSIHIDKFILSIVLRNIISNSMKYTVDGSIDIIGTIEGNNLIFIIKDTGKGISNSTLLLMRADNQSHINPNSDSNDSHGMGYNLCRSVIKIAGGDISISSGIGTGTVVKFSLPFLENTALDVPGHILIDTGTTNDSKLNTDPIPQQQSSRENKYASTSSSIALNEDIKGGNPELYSIRNIQNKRGTPPSCAFSPSPVSCYRELKTFRKLNHSIAFIDDDKCIIKIFTRILPCITNNQPLITTDADIIIDRCQEFDVIITDLYMPIINGDILAKKIRDRGYLGKIMLLSGSEDRFEELREKNLFDAMLLKPITKEQLYEELTGMFKI